MPIVEKTTRQLFGSLTGLAGFAAPPLAAPVSVGRIALNSPPAFVLLSPGGAGADMSGS